jgi:serine/threonine protein kinase
MSRPLSCPQGHHWEEADDHASASDAARCPTCGAPAEAATVASARPKPVPVNAATVLLSTNWQPSPPLRSEPPPQIPGYEILGELGRGGMGVVYQARHHADGRLVAIKVIRKDRLQDEDAVRRFRREAQATARASHPNIVSVLDSDQGGDTHYLVMEYVEGINLQRLVDERGPLPVDQACELVRQAALALQHAHEQALVHRDIKPSNLMVTGPGSGGNQQPSSLTSNPQPLTPVLKLLDLGVARLLPPPGGGPGESLSTLTQGGSVIGTADYIAPEQLEDPHGADIRADLYSLGCTFFYLLTGQVPFPGGSLISKLDKQRWQSPPSIAELRGDLPATVARIVQKLMAKQPADRYQTPAELVQILEALGRSGYRGPDGAALLMLRRQLLGHADTILSACFSPDGRRIASAGKDGTVQLWDTATGAELRALPRQPQEVRAIAFVAADRLASASGLSVRLWDASTGSELRRLSGHIGAVRCIAACADGQRLASGAEDRTVRVWDARTGRELLRYSRHTAGVTCLAAVDDTPNVLSGSRDQTLRLWDSRNGHDVRVLSPASGAVLAVAVAPDGAQAASAHFDTVIRLWDLATGAELRRFEGHRQMVSSLAFTADGRGLISAGQDQTVRLWDVATGYELSCLQGHAGGIHTVAVCPDGREALAAGADGTISVYEVAS